MASVKADLTLEISRLKAQLGAAQKELSKFKGSAEREGAGIEKALFGKLEKAKDRLKSVREESQRIAAQPEQQLSAMRQRLADQDFLLARPAVAGTTDELQALQVQIQREKTIQRIFALESQIAARSQQALQAQVAAARARFSGGAAAGGMEAFTRFGGGRANMQAMQMAGYQVQDFVVQVQAGQSPLRAFIQQGSQLAGAFGPWGAVIGAAGAIVGTLVGILMNAKEVSEDTKKALDELAPAIGAINSAMADMASNEAANALAAHAKAIDDLATRWDKSKAANEAYYSQMEAGLRATEQAQLAANEAARQRELALADSKTDREQVNLSRDNEAQRIKAAADEAALKQRQELNAFNRDNAQRGVDEISQAMNDIQGHLANALLEQKMARPDVLSDQQRLLDRYSNAEFDLNRGVDVEKNQAIVDELRDQYDNLRATLAAGKMTYEMADTPEEKRALDTAEKEKEAIDKRVETLQRELTMLEAQRAKALEVVSASDAAALRLNQENQALKDTVAANQDAAETRRQDLLKEISDAQREQVQKVRNAEMDFLPKSEQVQRLKQELSDIFNQANVPVGDMEALKQQDPEAYMKALENAKRGADLMGGNQMAMPVGAAQNAINVMTGRGPNQMMDRTNTLLDKMNSYMASVKESSGKTAEAVENLQTNPVFSFP